MMSTNIRRVAMLLIVVGAAFSGALVLRSTLQTPTGAVERVTVELTANTWRSNRQAEPAIAADDDGNLFVVWSSRRQEDGAFGVFAQLLDPLGRPIGTEVHVNQQIKGSQASPAVAIDPASGRALVVWESTHQDGSGSGVVGRWFEISAQGAHADTDEFAVNASRQGDQTAPSVAINASGDAMAAWTSDSPTGTAAVGRLFDADGAALTDEMRLGSAGAHSPIVAAAPVGFVVVGSSRDSAGRPAPLWMQRVDDGFAVSEVVAIADTPGEQDIEPAMGVDASGRVVVAWMRWSGRRYDVMRREFDVTGNAITPERMVETQSDAWFSGVAVAVAPDGRSVVSWNQESMVALGPTDGLWAKRNSDVVSQQFDVHGVSVGDPEQVHRIAKGRQSLPIGAVTTRTIWTEQDQIAHVWYGQTEEDSYGVGVRLAHRAQLVAPAPAAFDPRPAITPGGADHDMRSGAAPVFDPDFVPDPPEVNARGTGPDFGFFGDQNTGARPPDPEIAVGADSVVIVVNSRLTIRDKLTGIQSFSQRIGGASGFWGELGAGDFVFDPIAQYDTHTDRFVVAAAEQTNDESFVLIAISDDSDANGVWIKHRVNMTEIVGAPGGFLDYPILGIDEQSVSITENYFGDPLSAWIFVFDKAALMAGVVSLNPVQVSTFNPPTGAMMNYDPNPPAQYYASTWSAGADRLRLIALTDPNGSPTLFEHQLPVPQFAFPPDANQLGTTNLADTVDWRIKHGVVRNGSMWVAHNTRVTDIGPGGIFDRRHTAKVRWYEIELNGWPTSGLDPTLAQTGLIDGGFGVHSWHADISVDDAGNAAIIFNRSSVDEYISVSRAVRRVTDPPGTFRQRVPVQTSSTPEQLDRWGDYSGIQEDPFDPGVFWGHSEYRTASWRTWVVRFSPLTPNPLDFALLSPMDTAVEISVDATLDWEDAEDADSYDVAIATDPDLVNTVATTNVVGSSWAVPGGTLVCDTQYYWGVVANGVGGTSGSTPGVFSFTSGLLADLNGDNIVDTADLGLLLAAFGTAGPVGDLNGDGAVDTADLGLLLAGFGLICP